MNSNGSATIKTITPKQLAAKLQSREDIQLIDVREESERAIASIGGELIPMGTVLENLSRIRRDGAVVVYCRSGGRSGRVVEALQQDYVRTARAKGLGNRTILYLHAFRNALLPPKTIPPC